MFKWGQYTRASTALFGCVDTLYKLKLATVEWQMYIKDFEYIMNWAIDDKE